MKKLTKIIYSFILALALVLLASPFIPLNDSSNNVTLGFVEKQTINALSDDTTNTSTPDTSTEEDEEDSLFDLTAVTANTNLSIRYNKNTLSNITAKLNMYIDFTSSNYKAEAKYGVFYIETAKLEIIKKSYAGGNVEEFLEATEGLKNIDFTSTIAEANTSIKATLDTSNIDISYTMVGYIEYENLIYFTNQTSYSVKEMINYYINNDLITDEAERNILRALIY